MRWLILACLMGSPVCMRASDESNKLNGFWEPPLPNGQAFIAMRRAIKSYHLAKYNIYDRGERFPVVEMTVALTHQMVCFVWVGKSEGRKVAPTLKEIADGKYDEDGDFRQNRPGQDVPPELKKRAKAELEETHFVMSDPQQIEKMYSDFDIGFHIAFPW